MFLWQKWLIATPTVIIFSMSGYRGGTGNNSCLQEPSYKSVYGYSMCFCVSLCHLNSHLILSWLLPINEFPPHTCRSWRTNIQGTVKWVTSDPKKILVIGRPSSYTLNFWVNRPLMERRQKQDPAHDKSSKYQHKSMYFRSAWWP